MSEQLGVLKVIVVQGRRLVIRDFKTSDPYVVLKLGNQVTMIYIPFSSTQTPDSTQICTGRTIRLKCWCYI